MLRLAERGFAEQPPTRSGRNRDIRRSSSKPLTDVTRRMTMTSMSARSASIAIPVVALVLAACSGHPAAERTAAGVTQTASPSQSVPRLGTLHGSLLVTQPVSGHNVPWSGVVVLRGTSDYRVRVPRDGAFRMSVLPGSYVLTGRNPRFGEGAQFCRHLGGRSVKVRPGADVHANVVCLTTLG
jgi:hypothetical protein